MNDTKKLIHIFWSPPLMSVVAIVSLVLAIYGIFFYQRKPELQFEVISNSTVLNVRESLSKLEIFYGGTNLKAKKQNLRIITFRVVNDGSADILKAYYDESDPLGFQVSSGEILEPPTIIANEYLTKSLNPVMRDQQTVTFAPVILNAGTSFEVKLLVLVSSSAIPKIIPKGEIAGIKKIDVTKPYLENNKSSIWDDAIGGGPFVQLIRIPVYFLGFFLAFFLIGLAIMLPAALITKIVHSINKRKRKQRTTAFKAHANRKFNKNEQAMFQKYIDGSPDFSLLVDLLLPPGMHKTSMLNEHPPRLTDNGQIVYVLPEGDKDLEKKLDSFKGLSQAGLVTIDGPQLMINPDMRERILSFINYVRPELADDLGNQDQQVIDKAVGE